MRSLKVLILEPNPFQLMALHQMLNAIGIYDVLTAPSLASALSSLSHRGVVDIAICDPQLKGGDGLALIQHLAVQREARALILLGAVCPRSELASSTDLIACDHYRVEAEHVSDDARATGSVHDVSCWLSRTAKRGRLGDFALFCQRNPRCVRPPSPQET